MSDHKHTEIICPNCGSTATGNYCYQCGQETHLHKDTFAALLVHFVAHYFHYDSKFWQTMKALLFSPGKLTTAYWNKQRMRYIPPISLYIFISFVFFFTASLTGHKNVSVENVEVSAPDTTLLRPDIPESAPYTTKQKMGVALQRLAGSLTERGNKLKSEDKESTEFSEHFMHMLPKVFFFMIPAMAFLLSILFLRRKSVGFTSHVIFSLHFQSLLFSVMFVIGILPAFPMDRIVNAVLFLSTFIYFIVSLKRVYDIGWFRSVFYWIITTIGYCFILLLSITFAILLI